MALIVGNNNLTSRFQQQGTVDWVVLSDTLVSASLSLLSRISAADIDPTTVAFGQALCTQFKLSHLGQVRLRDAIAALHSFPSIGGTLHFGFGIKNPIRTLSQTAQGSTCIALCAALSEMNLGTGAAAIILEELAVLESAPEDMRPSLTQWDRLIQSCSCVFKTTNLGCFGEHFISLHPTRPERAQQLGNFKDIAKALRAVGQLSTGGLRSIDLVGDWTCGWIAAIAHWLFGLEIEIRNEAGEVVFQSFPGHEKPHVSVFYGRNPSTEMQLKNCTYFIREWSPLVHRETMENALSFGRVPWNEAIRRTFGEVGNKLIGAKASFGMLLGSAASLFAGIVRADEELIAFCSSNIHGTSSNQLRGWRGYNDSSFGRGYVTFATEVFPELGDLSSSMEPYLTNVISKSLSNYEVANNNLAMICGCKVCTDCPSSEDSTLIQRWIASDRFCLRDVAETIVILIWNISQMYFDIEIRPSRRGIEQVYQFWQEFQDLNFKFSSRAVSLLCYLRRKTLIQTAEAICTGDGTSLEDDCEWDSFDATNEESNYMVPASTHRGMCFYIEALAKLSDSPNNLARLHIVPGVIQLTSGRQYERVRDFNERTVYDDDLRDRKGYPVTDYIPEIDLDGKPVGAVEDKLEAKLVLRDSIHSIEVGICFVNQGAEFDCIGPCYLAESSLASTGLVVCSKRQCIAVDHKSAFTAVGEGFTSPSSDVAAGRSIVVRPLSGLARYLATANTYDPNTEFTMIQKGEKCVSCCIRAAMACSATVSYIIG